MACWRSLPVSETAFVDLCEQLAGNICLQWTLIVFGICFLEDVARCAVGLLVATGRLDWWFAFSGMMVGSLIGDVGLYLIGRYAMAFCVNRRWINAVRVEKMKGYFSIHAVKAIVGARFFPGARTVAYTAAGATHYRILKFLSVLTAVTVLQNLIYLYGTELVGERVLGCFEDVRMRWIAGGLLLLVIISGHFIFKKRNRVRREHDISPPL